MIDITSYIVPFCDESACVTEFSELNYSGGIHSLSDVLEASIGNDEIICLTLTQMHIQNLDFSVLRKGSRIAAVRFINCSFPSKDFSCSTLPPIRSLSFQGCDGTVNLESITNQAEHLKELDIWESNVAEFGELTLLQALEELRISLRDGLDPQLIGALSSLRELIVINEGTYVDLSWISRLKRLQVVSIAGKIDNLLSILELPELNSIILASTNVSLWDALLISSSFSKCYIVYPWTKRLLFSTIFHTCVLILKPMLIGIASICRRRGGQS